MQIILAQAMGMCFGVRDALDLTENVPNPAAVTVHGELVHNPLVLAHLADRGFHITPEPHRAELPPTPVVLITAHGISDRERHRLADAGRQLIDTTCPLVRRAHRAARLLAADARHVIVIGKPGHVEVLGLTGDLPSYNIVNSPADVRTYPNARLGVVCQTTTPTRDAREILAVIAHANPAADIRFLDTICQPTKDRQHAMDALLAQVDAVVVVGGRNSNNTRQLVARCADRGVPAFHVEHADELQPHWFTGCHRVGLTAGTSTLPATIDRVHRELQRLAAATPVAA